MAEEVKPNRRMVKKATTIRQLTEKSSQKQEEKAPGVLWLSLRYIAAPFTWVGKGFAKIGHKKPFRIAGRILLPSYFRNSWKELRQVTWPNRRESWALTSAVIVFAVIFGVLIALVDYGLDKLFKQVLLK